MCHKRLKSETRGCDHKDVEVSGHVRGGRRLQTGQEVSGLFQVLLPSGGPGEVNPPLSAGFLLNPRSDAVGGRNRTTYVYSYLVIFIRTVVGADRWFLLCSHEALNHSAASPSRCWMISCTLRQSCMFIIVIKNDVDAATSPKKTPQNSRTSPRLSIHQVDDEESHRR